MRNRSLLSVAVFSAILCALPALATASPIRTAEHAASLDASTWSGLAFSAETAVNSQIERSWDFKAENSFSGSAAGSMESSARQFLNGLVVGRAWDVDSGLEGRSGWSMMGFSSVTGTIQGNEWYGWAIWGVFWNWTGESAPYLRPLGWKRPIRFHPPSTSGGPSWSEPSGSGESGPSTPMVTPEPASMILLGTGLFGLGMLGKRKKQQAKEK